MAVEPATPKRDFAVFKDSSDESHLEKLKGCMDHWEDTIDVDAKTEQTLEEAIDDLDERVATCFAGIADFLEFRDYFRAQLEEIKSLNELNDSVVQDDSFSQYQTDDAKVAKSGGKYSRGRLEGSILKTSKSLLLSEDVNDCCRNCARYRGLLRSFQITQEADNQKQREQEKTIEKLSTAFLNSGRYRPSALSRQESGLRDSLSLLDRKSNFNATPRRRLFESPTDSDPPQTTFGHGSADAGSPVIVCATSEIPGARDSEPKTRLSKTMNLSCVLPTTPTKNMTSFVRLMKSAEKDRVDVVFYQNKISALELEIANLRANQPASDDIKTTAVSSDNQSLVSQLDERNTELRGVQGDLKKAMEAGDKLNEVCEEAVKLLDDEKRENAGLKEEVDRLRKEVHEFHNTTHDTSVAGAFTTSTPVVPFPSHGQDELHKLQEKHDTVVKAYIQLEHERRDLDADVQDLQEQIRRITKREQSIVSHARQEVQQCQAAVDTLKKENITLKSQQKETAAGRAIESHTAMDVLKKENLALKGQLKETSASRPAEYQTAFDAFKKENLTLKSQLKEATAGRPVENSSNRMVDELRNQNAKLHSELDEIRRTRHDSSSKVIEELRTLNAGLEGKIANLTMNRGEQMAPLQRAIDDLNRANTSLQSRLNELMNDRNRLNDEVKKESSIAANLRRELEMVLNKPDRDGEALNMRAEIQNLRSKMSAIDLENVRLKASSARREQMGAAGSASSVDDVAPLRNRIDDLMKEVARGEIKIQQLTDRIRSRAQAEEQIAQECFLLKGQLVDEKKRTGDISDKWSVLSSVVTDLRNSNAEKDRQIAELSDNLRAEHDLLSQAQTRFDESNKGFLSKLVPWGKQKSQVAVQPRKYAPRRSKTLAEADTIRGTSAASTLPHRVESPLVRTVVDSRTATLPSTFTANNAHAKNIVTTKVQFESKSSPVRSASQQTLKMNTPQNSPLKVSQQNLKLETPKSSPLNGLKTPLPVPEPYLPAQHSHQLKKTLLWFSQKCSVCLGDVPGLHHALKCTVCKHIYHTRCSAIQSQCAEVTELDMAEIKQRRSLNAERVSSGTGSREPTMSGHLLVTRDLNLMPFESVYVTLVGETVTIFDGHADTAGSDRTIRETIDLNEQRCQAAVTCETIPKELSDLPLKSPDDVNIFAIHVNLEDASITKSWFFRAPGILAKLSWTEAIGNLLMENEVDHVDTAPHFEDRLMVDLKNREDLEVTSVICYDQYLLLGTSRGIWIQKGKELVPVDIGSGEVPVFRLGVLEPKLELLAIVGHDYALKKASLTNFTVSIQSDLPKLTFTPFSSISHCHLFEISGLSMASATRNEVSVYHYNEAKRRWEALGQVIKLARFCPGAGDILTKCLLFSHEGLVIGLDKYYVFDVKTGGCRELLDSKDDRLSHWCENGHPMEYGDPRMPMGIFPVPSLEAHKRIRKACDREYLLCFRGGCVFIDGTGRKTRSHEVIWKREPRAIYYMKHFIYVMHYNSIQVRKVMPADDAYSVSPAFFMQMNDPRFLGTGHPVPLYRDDDRDSRCSGLMVSGKNLRFPFSPEIHEITATISDEEVADRRRMRNDNDTASTSSLALTDMA